ncbi:MAG: ribonuclease-3 [Thermoproteota archaeon]|jgi:ribonuclease-3
MFFKTVSESFLLSSYANIQIPKDLIGKPKLSKLQDLLGYQFNNPLFLIQALQHKSFCNEFPRLTVIGNNEKMEFMGDAVLDLAVADKLYEMYPEENEGTFSKLRSFLVKEESLSTLARFIKLDQFVLLGKGEYKNEGFQKDSILSDTFEAIICAVFMDSSYLEAKKMFFMIISKLEKETNTSLLSLANLDDQDFKSKLQVVLLQSSRVLPEYVGEELSEGLFQVSLLIDNKKVLTLEGPSKKKTEQELAKQVFTKQLYKTN